MIRTVCIMMTARELKEHLDAGRLPVGLKVNPCPKRS